ncbi:hypothetical protein, partial [Helicobacter kayseriensis]|uniref:hypothetical protein n=1 Tax=Helicobacter kayseriensis TaxID=2905877 RepID=UPI001E64FBB3
MRTNQTRKFKLFRPIVASSLALVLGSGSVYGECTATASADSNLPILCSGTTSSEQNVQSNILGWNATQEGLPSSAYIPTLHDQHGSVPEKLTFKFMDSSGSSGKVTTDASGEQTEAILKAGDNNTATFVTLKGNTKGIQMGASGTGTLVIDFGNGADVQRNFTLDLSNTAEGEFSFKGNILVKSGKGHGGKPETHNSKFVGIFGKDVIGKIQLLKIDSGNTSGASNELTFKERANLIGNLEASSGKNTITFENGSILGSVSASSGGGTFGTANTTITFKGENTQIQGKVSAFSGTYGGNGTNNIFFEKGGAIRNASITHSDENTAILAEVGINNITFKSQDKSNSIKGDIIAKNTTSVGGGSNTITFGDTSAQAGISSSSVTNSIAGNISAQATSTNTITFNTAGTNTITGSISAGTTAYGGHGKNIITFGASSTQTALLANSTNTITGNISVSGGTNTITFNTAGTNTISGNITADSGDNNITFAGTQGNNIYSGDITAGTGGSVAQNKILFGGSSTSFGKDNERSSVKAKQTNGNRTNKENLIQFTSTTNKLFIDVLESKIETGNGGNGIARNILSFDHQSGSSTISINTIEAGGSGSNYIG